MEPKRSILELMKLHRIGDLQGGNRFTKDSKEIDAVLKASIQRHGQTRPVYIDKENNIIEGSRIVRMMAECGHLWVQAVAIDPEEHHKIQHINNLTWYELNFAALGRRLKDQQDILKEIPLSGQDVIDFIDFSDFNADDYKDVKIQLDLFE